jgi:hypothetical protein
MPQVDPWGSTNQGLAQLGNTFDDLNNRRLKDEQMARQAQQDALHEPILRNQAAMGELQLSEAQRKAEEDKSFRTGLASLEDKLSSGTPSGDGKAPMTENDKDQARLSYAISVGNLDAAAKIAKMSELKTDMQSQEYKQMDQAMKAIRQTQATVGTQAALLMAKDFARKRGMSEEDVAKIVMSPQGIVSTPDGQGGTIITMPLPDGTFKLVHAPAKEPSLKAETLAERIRHDKAMENKPGAGKPEGQAKIGAIGQVNRELAARFLPLAKENVKDNSEAAKIMEGINISLGTTDQFGGSVNDVRLYDALTPDQRKEYTWKKTKAQDYAGIGMNPSAAVTKAEKDWSTTNPDPPKPTAKKRDVSNGVSYLKRAKDRNEAITRIRDMAAKGWSKDDIAAAAKEANWE